MKKPRILPKPTVLVIMPLSRSAIPFSCLMQAVLECIGWSKEYVQVALPLKTRGESIPMAHCVRHRRTVEAEDQYTGIQHNVNQEYIYLTRGMLKTCMWVEIQPFGSPHSFVRKMSGTCHAG